MRLFGIIRIPSLRQLVRKSWMRIPLIILGIACLMAAIWFGFGLIPWWPFFTIWLRLTVMGVVLALILLTMFLRWRRRRRAAQALEEELIQEPVGDGDVLNERMTEALAKLKRSGGKTYLYDLPWYIIIGPPGAGKTTALRNSGIEFPGSDLDAIEGFGGTKNCDWWFAEEAVMIDTAGRYTTQDSDAEADKLSWSAFLTLLKKGRPKQPINGVMLAFSAEDMMTATEQDLIDHAATVRARLAEIHEVLKIDFPVYVLFTKADLISGFREYFSSFSLNRRKAVWGTTFQTKDRKAQTYQQVPEEFDALVARLSDEVIDRMSEEPDGISRISIFGLPGQMALLRDNVSDFLRRVFEPTRYDTNAILRGFYFTSGTQEGNPIDQVLGAMSRNAGEGAGAFQPEFMSGKGKSYFLHDLMRQVIFAERDWVNHDAKAVRRAFIARTVSLSFIGIVTLGLMAALGWSFWQNASLIRSAQADGVEYQARSQNVRMQEVINDPEPSPVLAALREARLITAGYGQPGEQGWLEGFGLGQRAGLNSAGSQAYSGALERLLRPRMILRVENDLEVYIRDQDVSNIYRALKVYMLLGGEQPAGVEDDAAIIAYFNGDGGVWSQYFNQLGQADTRDDLNAHVEAMLELDETVEPSDLIDPALIERARREIVDLPLAEQRWAVIKEESLTAEGIGPFVLTEAVGDRAEIVFRTKSGDPLDTVTVPALFTFDGYWGFFIDGLSSARRELEEDSWVLGEVAGLVGYDDQLGSLERDLQGLYRTEFRAAWIGFFEKIEMAPMSTDGSVYNALETAGADRTSPILKLVEAVRDETRLVRLFEDIDGIELDPAALASGDLGSALGDQAYRQLFARGGAFQRVILDFFRSGGDKDTQQAGGREEDSLRRQVERIGDTFEDWHILVEGEEGARDIDQVLRLLRDLRTERFQAARSPSPADAQTLAVALVALTQDNSSRPPPLAEWINQIDREFRRASDDQNFTELNRVLNDEISQFCQANVINAFPFGDGRGISSTVFAEFFGPNGKMDRYFNEYLSGHVDITPDGLRPRAGSAIGDRLAPATLRQFERAAAIRDAFFISGSPEPTVRLFITHVSSSPSVQIAILKFSGDEFQTRPGDPTVTTEWSSQSASVQIQLFPTGNNNTANFGEGRWGIVEFLRRGRPDRSGTSATVTYQIGGRSITYRVEADSTTMPFLMPELTDFSCPVSLE